MPKNTLSKMNDRYEFLFYEAKRTKVVSVAIPPELYTELLKIAHKNRQKMNGFINHVLTIHVLHAKK